MKPRLLALLICLTATASASAKPLAPNPLAGKYLNARALAQALRDYTGSSASIVFWPNTPRQDGGQVLGQYVPPKRGQTRGIIYLSTVAVNALDRLARGQRSASDLDVGAVTMLHESNHSIGECRLLESVSDAERKREEIWAQRQAEVQLSQLTGK